MKISKVIPPLIFVSLFLFSCKPVNDDTPTYTDFSALNNGTPSEKLYELTIELETPQSDLINPDENDYLFQAYYAAMEKAIENYLATGDTLGTGEGFQNLTYGNPNIIDADIHCEFTGIGISTDNESYTEMEFEVINSIDSTINLYDEYISFRDCDTRILTEGTISGTSDHIMSFDLDITIIYSENETDNSVTLVEVDINSGTVTLHSDGLYTITGFDGLSEIDFNYTITMDIENNVQTITSMTGEYIIDDQLPYDFNNFLQFEEDDA